MHEHLHGIGAVARRSGLPVSALRFYDAAGVLRPAWCDPVTGYRWYSSEQVSQASLIARLRQVEMPLADITEVLASRHRPDEALTVLDRHLHALESRFALALEQLSDARELLADLPVTRFEVSAADLTQALAAVRYAVASDQAWPALTGILLDCSAGVLRLVACDRARLAVASMPVERLDGPPIQVVVPPSVLESLPDREGGSPGAVGLSVEMRADRVSFSAPGAEPVVAEPVAAEYPDYRTLLRATWTREVRIPASDLVSRVVDRDPAVDRARPDVVAVLLGDRGVDVVQPSVPGAVAYDRAYLLEALAATGGDDVVLSLDAARRVLAVARQDRPEDRSLLMPVRLRLEQNAYS
ncbi:MerR family transcriptional regulator [Promicromonospora panici]|uniref:DNA polymerase III subunit beta family protein n=1 Tax=Promicromonospora panici TaxID=2219658 RepID=UPI00101D63FD|nr:MerR family transcriptional regulator [Promicromonospora panici]